MRIRPAIAEDIDPILDLQRMAILSRAGSLYAPDQLDGLVASLSSTSHSAAIASGQVFVAQDDQARLVGFGQFNPNEAAIVALCVATQHQGQGIGRALARECLLRARRAGLIHICVNAPRDAIGFYERLSFEPDAPAVVVLPDGVGIERVCLSRPVEDPFVQKQIRALERSIRFFGAGQGQQRERDRFVVAGFLRGLRLTVSPEEITHPSDPPDAVFRGANFEVKELYPPARRRHQEYKDELTRARDCFWPDELLTHYTPEDISLDALIHQVAQVGAPFTTHYDRATRSTLDLLVYANLPNVHAISPSPLPDPAPLESQGWRSVSFFRGSATSYVITARDGAPAFLRAARGQLLHGPD